MEKGTKEVCVVEERAEQQRVLRALFVSGTEVKTLNRDDESHEALSELKETDTRLKELYLATRRSRWTWQAAGSVFGLAGGLCAATFGTLLSGVAWVLGDAAGGLSLHGLGSVLLLSTIPLLVVSACCLDLLDKRTEKSGEMGLGDATKVAGSKRYARLRRASIVLLR